MAHDTLKVKDLCPDCGKGKLYELESPGVLLRVVGQAPLQATVYELEKLRCNLCGADLHCQGARRGSESTSTTTAPEP